MKSKRKRFCVHAHSVRANGATDSYWTRCGLTKTAAAAKLAREQRKERGGKARVVAE